MSRTLSHKIGLLLLWLVLTITSLFIRPLIPVDETRYAAVAWEMWSRGDFLVPHLNGEAYSHKPPLLFWLIQFNWWLFGVNDWSLRLISPLFSLATLHLSYVVARNLWPDRTQIAETTPFILLGFIVWMVFSTLTMFDVMLSYFALVGMYALIKLRSEPSFKCWAVFGIAIGLGVLTKGPVIFLHLLPTALLAPWWSKSEQSHILWSHWYGGLILAILIGSAIALSWAIPAGMAGGETYRKAIFLGQTSGRVADSFAHRLPFWWYLELLPVLLLPWLLLKPFWAAIRQFNLQDKGIRFCAAWVIPVFIAFSMVSGKRIHYLLPLLPGLALMLAWAMDKIAGYDWRRAHSWYAFIFAGIGLVLGFAPWLNGYFHWRPEMGMVVSAWGVLLCVGAAAVGWLSANNMRQAIGYTGIVTVVGALAVAGSFFDIEGKRYDTAAPSQKIAELMEKNCAIALYGAKYHGQFHFAGRLTQAIEVIPSYEGIKRFAERNPDGYILVNYEAKDGLKESVLSYHYPLKGQNVGFLSAKALLGDPNLRPVLGLF